MLVVNLWGAPGSGKSTGAAYVFSHLKLIGINCEIVTEFAKDAVWERRPKIFENQVYIIGKQSYKLSRLKDEVDVVITDAPLGASMYYIGDSPYRQGFIEVCRGLIGEYENLDYYVERVKPYNPKGRFQTEEGVIKVNEDLKKLWQEEGHLYGKTLDFWTITGDEKGYSKVVKDVTIWLSENR